MLGKALKALLDDGNHWKSLCAGIGMTARGRVSSMTRRTRVPGDGGAPSYVYEITFACPDDMLRFASGIEECVRAAKKEGE